MILVFGIMLAGCKMEPEEGPYTVWTGTTTYNDEFIDKFGDLEDGYYFYDKLTDAEFRQISPSLRSSNKHKWTEDQLVNWFTGRDFDNSQARELTSWLIKNSHGYCAARTRTTVYIIIK